MGKQPKITANTIKVLWVCNRDGETYLMQGGSLKSHKLCPFCGHAMAIEKTVEGEE